MEPVLRYFRDQATVRNLTVSVSATYAQVVGYDSMRYALSVWNDGTIDLTVLFGDQTTGASGTLHVPGGMGPVFLSEDVLGELIRLPVWVKSATAGPTSIVMSTVSYDPDRYRQMERYVHGCLAEYGAL